jgi:alkanesulfonate monooxygenase SsuD/methylene tetrahydromethanopterin reductase-like flavin-dependent oxidoreductase (luciferase family)
VELGIYSFGELLDDPGEGQARSIHERFDQILELARLADAGGLDIITLGEHHRLDFSMSAPEIVLAAIAGQTTRIRLASGVTCCPARTRCGCSSSSPPWITSRTAGPRSSPGAFTESFPLFGYVLADYDDLFDEKLRMLLQLREEPVVTWSGRFRPALHEAAISPRPVQQRLPIWVAIGGTPASAVRAGLLGLPW